MQLKHQNPNMRQHTSAVMAASRPQRSMPQHSTSQHSATQHSTAQCSAPECRPYGTACACLPAGWRPQLPPGWTAGRPVRSPPVVQMQRRGSWCGVVQCMSRQLAGARATVNCLAYWLAWWCAGDELQSNLGQAKWLAREPSCCLLSSAA